MVKTSKLVKVRTGPTSYLKMTEKDAAAYRKDVGEYGVDDAPADEPEAEAKAEDQPAENKQRRGPAQKKSSE